jgi:hypothetical protein
MTISERYELRLAAERSGTPLAQVWHARNLPVGWAVDQFLADGPGSVFVWRAVNERTGAVDHQPHGIKSLAVRRAWELAARAERRSAA